MVRERIVKVVFNLGVNKEFDYSVPRSMNVSIGSRVLVEFNRKIRVAVVVSFVRESSIKNIKPILEVLDVAPSLDREHLKFARRLSKEYLCPWGEIVFMMLPIFLRKKAFFKEKNSGIAKNNFKKKPSLPVFVRSIIFNKRFSFYKKEIDNVLRDGSVIMFLPTIEHAERVYRNLEDVLRKKAVIIHSSQRQKEYYDNWLRIKKGNVFIVSTRVGLFHYPHDLGLVIVEEENSPYYFNHERPYYHLVDAVKILSSLKSIKLILSGDYPRVSTYKECQDKKISLVEKKDGKKNIEVLHFNNFYKGKKRIFTPFIIEVIRKSLEEEKKILILWNRNNFCSFLKCTNCGYIPSCVRCSTYLRMSLKENKGICPFCGAVYDIEKVCSNCSLGYIKPIGVGIERLEAIMRRIFPEYKIEVLKKTHTEANIILSTSKVANYLFNGEYNFNIAIVLDADSMLSSSDYNATYSTFVYLKKISSLAKEKVFIFTHSPHYYLWNCIVGGWKKFYRRELALRKELGFPPYVRLVKITLRAKNENKLFNLVNSLYNNLKRYSLCVLGPFKESPFKGRGLYRYSVVAKFKSKKRFLMDVDSLLGYYRRYSKIAVIIE